MIESVIQDNVEFVPRLPTTNVCIHGNESKLRRLYTVGDEVAMLTGERTVATRNEIGFVDAASAKPFL